MGRLTLTSEPHATLRNNPNPTPFHVRFMVMMTAKMGEKDSRDDVLKAFQVFDSDETGAIDLKKLDRVAKVASAYSVLCHLI